MSRSLTSRLTLLSAALTVLAAGLLPAAPALAREGNSIGHGVKCYWVLTSSANGVNVYKQVCRKGV